MSYCCYCKRGDKPKSLAELCPHAHKLIAMISDESEPNEMSSKSELIDETHSTTSTSQRSDANWNDLEPLVATGFENHCLKLIEGRERFPPFRPKRMKCSRYLIIGPNSVPRKCNKKTRYTCTVCLRPFCKRCSLAFHSYELPRIAACP